MSPYARTWRCPLRPPTPAAVAYSPARPNLHLRARVRGAVAVIEAEGSGDNGNGRVSTPAIESLDSCAASIYEIFLRVSESSPCVLR
ncbi:hypothetical protein BGW80DRAFT_1276494 [Lactifluus volemus]|nr:hypothetical protein BGW80DRAFT_1276494 [Lactifluus volemus]